MDQPNFSAAQQKTDEEIARLVQSGDIEIFRELVARYEAKLKRYGKKFLSGDQAAVEDAVQETFLKSYVNIKSYDSSRRFSSWIYRIAHNEFINVLKKKEKGALLFFDPDVIFPHPIAKEKTDKDAEDRLTSQMVGKCMDRLPFKYREVLVLFYQEEQSYEEIAEILRIPVSTVGVRLKRGREAAKQICQEFNLF
jgi:RNA polymerase sigma-70 factor (ECF subfamily)